MRTHNNLLLSFPGCDGFKTGYFRLAGYSIAATAQSEGARAIVVVLGSPTKEGRDTVARKLLAAGLATAKSRRPPAQSFPTVSTNTSATASARTAQVTTTAIQTAETPTSKLPSSRRRWWPWALGAMVVVFLVVSYRRQQWGR
jgi:D-alanyl-D-alanine carboxypeptidase (penicillin-binding protein 5/6)